MAGLLRVVTATVNRSGMSPFNGFEGLRAHRAAIYPAARVCLEAPQIPHKSALRRRPHTKPTDETGLRGIRRHGCYNGGVSLLTSVNAGEQGSRTCCGIVVPGVIEPLKAEGWQFDPAPDHNKVPLTCRNADPGTMGAWLACGNRGKL